MKNILHVLWISFLTLPIATAYAHTRWFAEANLEPYVTNEPTSLYIGIWASIIIVIILIAAYAQRYTLLELHMLKPTRPHAFERAASSFTMIAGAYFVIAGSHEYFLTPNLTPEAGIPYFIIIAQILIGLSLLIGIGARAAAIALIGVWLFSFFYSGFIQGIENVWVLSTGLFIAFMGNDYFSIYSNSWLRDRLSKFKRYGLSILRIGTGLTLMVLGLSEKITAPEFGINFLNQYNWNFMQILGFEYSHYLFTISAGAVEFLFGLLFVLGIMTRITALVVAIVFTIPLFLLGPIELTGHLPHFVAIVLLLLFGNGGYFLLCKKKK